MAIDLNGYDTSDAGTETTTELATRAAKVSTGRRAQGKIKEGDPERFFASAAEDTTDNEGEIDSTELDHELWCVLSDSFSFPRQTFSLLTLINLECTSTFLVPNLVVHACLLNWGVQVLCDA